MVIHHWFFLLVWINMNFLYIVLLSVLDIILDVILEMSFHVVLEDLYLHHWTFIYILIDIFLNAFAGIVLSLYMHDVFSSIFLLQMTAILIQNILGRKSFSFIFWNQRNLHRFFLPFI